MSVAEGASEASSLEQANKWAVRVNERTDERVAQNSVFLVILAHSGPGMHGKRVDEGG